MDKIYSRSRIRLPRLSYSRNRRNRNSEKTIKIILILVIALLVMFNMLSAIDPIFEKLCIEEAKSLVTIEVNTITTNNANKYRDREIITVKQDENGNIQLLQVNSEPLNSMISDITIDTQDSLNNNDRLMADIPFGSITGIKWISGIGPRIPIKVALSGTIQTKVRNEFNEAGINQTVHRLWLDIICDINILTPYEVISTQVTNEIILSENVIVGGVPTVYMNSD